MNQTEQAKTEETNQQLMDQAAQTGAELPLSIRQMLEAGVHFGHQLNRWNPKMKPYIFGARNGIHIIDLQQTVRMFQKAYQFIINTVAKGAPLLFVGTKKQCQELIQEEATRAGMFHVTNRWLGGTLTNFRTVKTSVERLRTIEKMAEDGTFDRLNKKEVLMYTRQQEKLEKALGGIKNMSRLPGALFVVDAKKEHLAVTEARKLNIPVIAIADTNCDPDLIDYLIPGNDDALRSVGLILNKVADACIVGTKIAKERAVHTATEEQPQTRTPGHGPKVETARRRGGNRPAPVAVATPASVTVAQETTEETSKA